MRSSLLSLRTLGVVCGIVFCCGCSHGIKSDEFQAELDRVFVGPEAPLHSFAWVAEYTRAHADESLVTVNAALGTAPTGSVYERRRVGNRIVCEAIAFQDGNITRELAYDLTDPGACATLAALMRVTRQTESFTLPGYNASPPIASCLIVTGDRPACVYIEGGILTTRMAIQEWQRYLAQKSEGEPILDGDLATAWLDEGTFADSSVLLELAIRAFDDLCDIAADANADAP
jgi:hypothetical protein